ncbi:MAG: type pilus assembly protein PilA [Verrucomicrobiota bacterium]|jgi:prepilin-type N-terminal cleavage/methylation domain-containing protein
MKSRNVTLNGFSRGFTLVEMLIVVVIIGLLAVLAWPNYIKYRSRAQVGACINNLQKIEGAKAQWAFENRKDNDAIPDMTDLTPFLQHSTTPACPSDGTYRPRRVSKQATCSFTTIGHVLSTLSDSDDPSVD